MDVVFLQETYSCVQNLKSWEAELGGKMIGSHGTSHSRGVMILFKSKLDVNIEQIISDKNHRYILAEALVEGEKFVFLNIYPPNDQTQQVQFLRGLSNSVLNKYAGERIVLGGDLNCVMNEIDKRSGRSFEQKKTVIQEMKTLMGTHNLIDTWSCKHPNKQAFTWNNSSKKIYCRLDYLFISKSMESAIQNANIVPNIFSDHSAITLSMSLESNETKRGPGFWKFNNSLLTDKSYTEMITKQIPEFISKYCNLNDKGLFWEMIKMEIRPSTIIFPKNKAKQKRNEEKLLLMRLNQLQEKLRSNSNEATKVELDRVKKS